MSASTAFSSSMSVLRQSLQSATRRSPAFVRPIAVYLTVSSSLHTCSPSRLEQQQQQPLDQQQHLDQPSTSSSPSPTFIDLEDPNLDPDDLEFYSELVEHSNNKHSKLVAEPTKSSIVHVKLAYLSRLSKPLKGTTSDDLEISLETAPRKLKPDARYVPMSSHVFDTPLRRDIVHSAVIYYTDSLRQGTASTKTRSDVRGSKKKLRPQKGSGRARLGTMSSPMLRGGAVAHGPKPRDHSTELPRRVRELALRSVLSAKWRQGDLHVVASLDWIPPPSTTGPLKKLLGSKGWTNALFLTSPRHPSPSPRTLLDEARPSASDPIYTEDQKQQHFNQIKNFVIASKNIQQIDLVQLDNLTKEFHENIAKDNSEKKKPGELHAYQIVKRKKIICDLGAIEWLEEKLGGAIFHEKNGLDVITSRFEQFELKTKQKQETIQESVQEEEIQQ